MKRIFVKTIALSASLALTQSATAAGFKLNEQSASGTGKATAGQAAIADDASVVFYNPAGMVRLDKKSFTAGMAYLDLEGELEGSGTNKASYDIQQEYDQPGDFIPTAFIPFAYYAQPINDKWFVGIGLFTPFGTHTNYDNDSVAAAYSDKTSLKTIDIQPTIAFKVNENFSIGGGLDFLYMKNEQSKRTDLIPYNPAFITNPYISDSQYIGYENRSVFTGDGTGIGWNFGLLWQNEKHAVAFAYRSQIDLTLEGEVELLYTDNVQYIGFDDTGTPILQTIDDVADEDAEVDISTPQSATFSYAYNVTDRLRLLAGTTWTGYSSFEYYDIKSTENEPGAVSELATASGLGDGYLTHIVEKWKDDWAFAVGLDYQATPKTVLRMGYALDQSPIDNRYRITRQPGNDRRWLTLGFGYHFTPSFSMDVAAAYLRMGATKLDDQNYDINDEVIESNASFEATQKITGYGVSVQFNYEI